MNVIAKISYLERSVVRLKLRKNIQIQWHNTSILLWIKNWTVWYIQRYSVSTYTGVRNCQKQSGFLVHPAFYFFECMYGYGFLSRGFADRREILHGGSAWSRAGLLVYWGIAPGMAEFWASTGRHMAGYVSCCSTCIFLIFVSKLYSAINGE